MSQITTEITSSKIPSDNPIHQRLLFAYEAAKGIVSGNILEVGCGEGRGMETLSPYCSSYTAIDKNRALLDQLALKYPSFRFIETNVPPFLDIQSNQFDVVIAFQVIEHIRSDEFFVKEIQRVLKTGGKAIIATPNSALTLTRNPWHEREYTSSQLQILLNKFFRHVDVKGITGNRKVFDYFDLNRKAVKDIASWDVLDLQNRLPASWLRVPYDILNRMNRNRMLRSNSNLVSDIDVNDFSLSTNTDFCFDLFFVATK
ncbi:MAG: class I SAM-dependent methyltransferase [Cytophagales bacterium]